MVKLQTILFATILWALCFSCGKELGPSKLDGSSNVASLPLFTCADKTFEWGDKKLGIDKLLAEGGEGRVYSLTEDNVKSNNLVLKILTAVELQGLERMIGKEVNLSKWLKGIYPQSDLYKKFRASNSYGTKMLAGFILREKVNGFMLSELGNEAITLSNTKKQAMLESFRDFTKKLAAKLNDISKEGYIIWDLHPDNIMFDRITNKWMLIDAEVTEGAEQFKADLEGFVARDITPWYFAPILSQMSSQPADVLDEKFFEELINVYTKPEIKILEDSN